LFECGDAGFVVPDDRQYLVEFTINRVEAIFLRHGEIAAELADIGAEFG
jgi:hypothetical protein